MPRDTKPIEAQEGYNPDRDNIKISVLYPDMREGRMDLQVRPDTEVCVTWCGGAVLFHEKGTVLIVPAWLRESIINMPPHTDRICLSNRLDREAGNKDHLLLADASYEWWPKGIYARKKKKHKKLKKTKKRKV
jgi:hypothetical protein